MKGQKGKGQLLPIIMLYIIGFIAITMLELLSVNQNMVTSEVEVSFSWDNLAKQLPSLVVSYASLGCYTAATIMMQISRFKQNNDDYRDFESKIADFSKREYRPVIFNRYCVYTNRNRKIKAWKIQISHKWQRMEQFQTEKDYNAWCEYQRKKADNPEFKTENKYCKKREKLERLMSDKYIEENIDRIRVKYDAINSSLVLGGVMSNGTDMDEDEYLTKNKLGLILSEQLPRIFMMIALISIASSITVDAFKINTNWTVMLMFFFKMLVKIFSLINTVFSAIRYTEVYNERVTMKDIRFRWGICCEYTAWMKKEIKKQAEKKEEEKPKDEIHVAMELNTDEIKEVKEIIENENDSQT